jgi:hypothetical protein
LGLFVRIQVFDPAIGDELDLIHKLQDQFSINANSADPLPEFKWDSESLQALTLQYQKDAAQYSSVTGMMGPRGQVNEDTRHIVVATGWGLLPEWDAIYLNYDGDHNYNICHKATYDVPDNEAFWSITVYNSNGYMEKEKNIVNSSNVNLNSDGTFTVYFGSQENCGDVPNRVDVTEGWNFAMRIYRPGESVLNGTYKLPDAVPVQ